MTARLGHVRADGTPRAARAPNICNFFDTSRVLNRAIRKSKGQEREHGSFVLCHRRREFFSGSHSRRLLVGMKGKHSSLGRVARGNTYASRGGVRRWSTRMLPRLAIALALSGCAVGPNFKPPLPPATDAYTAEALPTQTEATGVAGGEAQHFQFGHDLSGQWWTLFGSTRLD